MGVRTIHKTYDTLLLILFLAVISAPLIGGMLLQDKEWSEAEKRSLVMFPQFPESVAGVSRFFQDFEQYYNDHFGFRELMISRYHREMEKRFGVAGTPLVLKGEGKWLYYTGNKLLDDFRGKRRLSDAELDVWATEQKRRYGWLQEKGIEYLSFSPPNKQTIYPEHMPQEFQEVKGVTRMAQLQRYLQKKPLPFFIDVQPLLKQAKSERKLYFAMDSHWNHYGAYVAFKRVIDHVQMLFPEKRYITEFPFHKHYRRSLGGDLARMLMIDKQNSESMPKVRPRDYCSQQQPFDIPLSNIGTQGHEQPLLKSCGLADVKAIVFCDSFIEQIEPFLSENFSQVLYLRKSYDEQNILEALTFFKPDIVIEERVERNYFRQIIDERK